MISAEFVVERDDFLMDIKLEIPSTGATVLFGPSGSGKTTLVDVMLGLLKADKGNIFLNEKKIIDPRKTIPVVKNSHFFFLNMPFQKSLRSISPIS